jgi:predicted nucleic acid-binding protein
MYLDTSIIIKLLVDEPDSEFFQSSLEGVRLSTSQLSTTEVWSALCSKERGRFISAQQRTAAWSIFNERVQDGQIILRPLNAVVLKKANRIIELCHPSTPLITLDAIHAATCEMSMDFPLCTTDRRMRDAAKKLGIPVFPEAVNA